MLYVIPKTVLSLSLKIKAMSITGATRSTNRWHTKPTSKNTGSTDRGPLITRFALAHKPRGLQPTTASWSTTGTYVQWLAAWEELTSEQFVLLNQTTAWKCKKNLPTIFTLILTNNSLIMSKKFPGKKYVVSIKLIWKYRQCSIGTLPVHSFQLFC